MQRVKTGIPGLDEITGGGFLEGQVVLLSGTCGTGKTTMCIQYIFEGLKKYNDNAVFLSFEETPDSVKATMKNFGHNPEPFEKKKRLSILKYDPYHLEDVFDILESTIRDMNAKRVVVDSISALGLHVRDRAELRRMIFNLSMVLKKLNCTSILVSEMVHGTPGISRYGVEEFVADTVIVLWYEKTELAFSRAIQVWKMKGSNHSNSLHPYRITEKGITINQEKETFTKKPKT